MMRGTIPILLVSALAVGCNYTKEKDPPPPVEVPSTYTEGAEVPPPPKH
ncbi:MAG: serine-type D-Ala-D-Ala carboxypeptidase, partial [Deltaproteobacteria bacterium]|nr:serine-type D-Ala-D-Ala carboxypeptidase [Deltaproteobacteria bacterium]